jgi:1D-myo-inositol 3-kinase
VDTPDFVVVGHAVRDLVPGGWRLGGTVTFAATQAHRLGLSVGVVTRVAPDMLETELMFASVSVGPSDTTTVFENVYSAGRRDQHIRDRAAAITSDDVPEAWRAAPIVLLGPVFGEIGPDFATLFADASLVGVSVQGWLRAADAEERVLHTPWRGEPFWSGCDALFVSDEDLTGGEDELERWTADVPIVAMTESAHGAQVYAHGRWRKMPAFPEEEVDATGAGDTFATAFLIRLHETGDVDEAARFGAAAASLSVGGVGAAAIPTRSEVEQRLQRYPEVALR